VYLNLIPKKNRKKGRLNGLMMCWIDPSQTIKLVFRVNLINSCPRYWTLLGLIIYFLFNYMVKQFED